MVGSLDRPPSTRMVCTPSTRPGGVGSAAVPPGTHPLRAASGGRTPGPASAPPFLFGSTPVTAPAPTPPRVIIGLLGGIASGKSTVSAVIARLGPGRVLDADALAKIALEAAARDGRLVAALGPWAVTKDGKPDRKAIAKKVFGDAPALRALERITHPYVLAHLDDGVNDHRL